MTATIIKLPTSATSFYEFKQRSPGLWVVALVTPLVGKSLRTTLFQGRNREAVLASAHDSAAKTHRPLKIRKGA